MNDKQPDNLLSASDESPEDAVKAVLASDTQSLSTSKSLAAFRRSQTFLARLPDPAVYKLRVATVSTLMVIFFILIPLLTMAGAIPKDRLTLLGRYLSFTVAALGIDLIWGYTGILSLCQAFFFCLGGYAIGMHLSLPEGGYFADAPDFLLFAYYGKAQKIPMFWQPFHSLTFSILAGVIVPMIAAAIFGFFIFRSRVRGVYFSIVTQAVAYGTALLFFRNELLLGGNNGLNKFYEPLQGSKAWVISLYLITLIVITLAYLLCRAITRSRLGKVLVAIRDKETRLYFAGYRPYAFKVFAFTVAGGLAGMGGLLYAPQMGLITPQEMSVEASILMVIGVALGGRGKLWGSIFGALLLKATFSSLTTDMPHLWLLIQGVMFVGVVLGFPDGVVGVWDQLEKYLKMRDISNFLATGGILLAVVLFVMIQSLGLMPRLLEVGVLTLDTDVIRLKYILLILLLGAGYARTVMARKKATPTKGFEVVPKGAA